MPPANTLVLEQRSRKTAVAQKRSHKTTVVLVSTAIALIVALAVLAMHWPFTKQAVIKSLQDASSSTVEITHFHRTYFPFPGCVAERSFFAAVLIQTHLRL
jgi:hypothetical protein